MCDAAVWLLLLRLTAPGTKLYSTFSRVQNGRTTDSQNRQGVFKLSHGSGRVGSPLLDPPTQPDPRVNGPRNRPPKALLRLQSRFGDRLFINIIEWFVPKT